MPKLSECQRSRDSAKLLCLFGALAGSAAVFVVIPILFYSTLIALVLTTVLAPLVSSLERRTLSRTIAITGIFTLLGITLSILGGWGLQLGLSEWDSFKIKAPESFFTLITQLRIRESHLKAQFPYLEPLRFVESISQFGQETKKWFDDYGLSAASQFLTLSLLVPVISFILLKDGKNIQKFFLYLVPNRFFESFYQMSTEISIAISGFIRAKLIEAILVGLLVCIGMLLIRAPSPFILGALAGITNIIPYLGPLIGIIPGILLATSIQNPETIIYSMLVIYIIVNIIDTLIIFPLIVGKLIQLHPFVLIGAVIIGQKYYGLVGMLISVPITASLKAIFREIYAVVYEKKSVH